MRRYRKPIASLRKHVLQARPAALFEQEAPQAFQRGYRYAGGSQPKSCIQCGSMQTPQWREGPLGKWQAAALGTEVLPYGILMWETHRFPADLMQGPRPCAMHVE